MVRVWLAVAPAGKVSVWTVGYVKSAPAVAVARGARATCTVLAVAPGPAMLTGMLTVPAVSLTMAVAATKRMVWAAAGAMLKASSVEQQVAKKSNGERIRLKIGEQYVKTTRRPRRQRYQSVTE